MFERQLARPSLARRILKSAFRVIFVLAGIAVVLLVIMVVAMKIEDHVRLKKANILFAKQMRLQFMLVVAEYEEMRAKYRRLLPETETVFAEQISKAQSGYMEFCARCAPMERCERDRLVIARAAASTEYNPCDAD